MDAIPPILPMRLVPTHLRPREKLRLRGAEALSDQELLAALLGSATRTRSVLGVAAELLVRGGQLAGLPDLGLAQMLAIQGLGTAGASRVAAALELARRLGQAPARAGARLESAAAVAELLRPELAQERRERVHVLMVDARQRLLGDRCVSVGSLMSSVIHPREVFRPAIELAAAAVILVHNHPSGDPTPSVEDHQVTHRVAEAGAIVGIRLLDHVIVAAEGFRSFKEEGWLR